MFSRNRYNFGAINIYQVRGWGYQDFAAGDITGTSVTLSANDNGTPLDSFDTSKIVSNTAVIVLKPDATASPPIVGSEHAYSGTTKLFSTRIRVTAHSGASITLNAAPHSSWGDLRIWYFYQYDFATPLDYTIPTKAIADEIFSEMDELSITEEEIGDGSKNAVFNTIENTPIGSTTPSTGAFTNLSFTGTLTGTLADISCGAITATGDLILSTAAAQQAIGVSSVSSDVEDLLRLANAADHTRISVETYSDGRSEYSSIDLKSSESDTLGTLTRTTAGSTPPQIFGRVNFLGVNANSTWGYAGYLECRQSGAESGSNFVPGDIYLLAYNNTGGTTGLMIDGQAEYGIFDGSLTVNANLSVAGDFSVSSSSPGGTITCEALKIYDPNANYTLEIDPIDELTANRTLSISVVDGNQKLTVEAESFLNQDLTNDANVTFNTAYLSENLAVGHYASITSQHNIYISGTSDNPTLTTGIMCQPVTTCNGSTIYCGYFQPIANHSGTTATAICLGLYNPSAQGGATITTATGLYISDISTGSSYNFGIYQDGTSSVNILNADTRIGSTAAPTDSLDVAGNIVVSGTVDGLDISTLSSELANLTQAEIQQLENIGTTTISAAQWGYVGAFNQALATTDIVEFSELNATTNAEIEQLGVGYAVSDTAYEKVRIAYDASHCWNSIECYSDTYNHYAGFNLKHSNNDTLGAKTTTTNGFINGTWGFYGVNTSSDWGLCTYIQAIQNGNAGSTYVPANLSIQTCTSTGINTNQILLNTDGSVNIGGNTNNVDIATGGVFTLNGTARVTKRFTLKYASTTTDYGYQGITPGRCFDPDADEVVYVGGFVPLDYASGTNLVVKFLWCPYVANSSGSSKYPYWQGAYSLVAEDDDADTYSSVSTFQGDEIPDGESDGHMHIETLTTITSGITAGDYLSVQLTRDADNAGDTYGSDIMVPYYGIYVEYTADKLGTAT